MAAKNPEGGTDVSKLTLSLSLSLDKSRAARLGASELLKWRERFYLGATNKLAPFERAFRCDRGDRPPNFIVGNGAPSFCLSAIRHLPPPLPSQHRLNGEITKLRRVHATDIYVFSARA